jgi:hypothetical protein
MNRLTEVDHAAFPVSELRLGSCELEQRSYGIGPLQAAHELVSVPNFGVFLSDVRVNVLNVGPRVNDRERDWGSDHSPEKAVRIAGSSGVARNGIRSWTSSHSMTTETFSLNGRAVAVLVGADRTGEHRRPCARRRRSSRFTANARCAPCPRSLISRGSVLDAAGQGDGLGRERCRDHRSCRAVRLIRSNEYQREPLRRPGPRSNVMEIAGEAGFAVDHVDSTHIARDLAEQTRWYPTRA